MEADRPCRYNQFKIQDSSMATRLLLFVGAISLASALAGSQGDLAPKISADRIKADVAYLASDRLEGRGPGTRGEILATEYIAAEFKKAGLKPIGKNDTYFQSVPLVRVVTSPKSTLQAVQGATTLDIPSGDGFAGTSHTQTELESLTPKRSSSVTALPRPNLTGTITRAWT
jgi:hypothetical protein